MCVVMSCRDVCHILARCHDADFQYVDFDTSPPEYFYLVCQVYSWNLVGFPTMYVENKDVRLSSNQQGYSCGTFLCVRVLSIKAAGKHLHTS